MKNHIDNIGYYLSCTLLFHFVYLINFLANSDILNSKFEWTQFILFLICFIFIGAGVCFTVCMFCNDDAIHSEATKGNKIVVANLKDLTGENYFTNYSLLVLTGVSLPVDKGIYSIILYLLVVFSVGIVYIRQKMIYMNPILTLLKVNIYECENAESKKPDERKYMILANKFELENGDKINYQNVSKKILRFNDEKCVTRGEKP